MMTARPPMAAARNSGPRELVYNNLGWRKMSAMKAKSANTSGSWMNWTFAREMATNNAGNTMVPAAAKAGRQENAKKKANTKANTAARRSRAAVQRARSGARGRVRNSTQVPPTWATAKAIRNAFIAR